MKLKKYSQLFEADIKDNSGIPSDYIEDVEKKGREAFGYTGPSHQEMGQMMQAMQNIMRIQNGKEDELTEIGKAIVIEQYGGILDDVKLDIKIVKPDDEEKMEMVQKMQNQDEEDEDDNDDGIQSDDIEIPDNFTDQEEVDKRKILNNIMQGEAQNVHSLMFLKKDDIDAINPDIMDFYKTLLDTNRKFDWFDEANLEEMVKQHPEMANAEEVEWEEDEEGNSTPVIKVRALDLPMLLHETIKGIYELIMANAIPENAEIARKVMEETDSLDNEKQDIKFGPFIAADIRDFLTGYMERNHKNDITLANIKEFIYGRIVTLEKGIFLELIYDMLSGDIKNADKIIKEHKIVSESILDAKGEDEEDAGYQDSYQEETYDDVADEDGELDSEIADIMGSSKVEEPKAEEPVDDKAKRSDKLLDMGKTRLNSEMNKAIDAEDWEYAKEVQAMLARKGLM